MNHEIDENQEEYPRFERNPWTMKEWCELEWTMNEPNNYASWVYERGELSLKLEMW